MVEILDRSWHLAQTDDEIVVTEFEFALWRIIFAFFRWQEDCNNSICDYDINAYELAVFHVIRMRDKPKTIYEISRLLNRTDTHNIIYSIKKLSKLKLVERAKSSTKKVLSYQATKLGCKIIDNYIIVRKNTLIKMLTEFKEFNVIPDIAKILGLLTGIYDEAGRVTATHKSRFL